MIQIPALCEHCLHEAYLKAYVANSADSDTPCTFGHDSPGLELEGFHDVFYGGLSHDWDDATAANSGYVSSEDDANEHGIIYSTEDLLDQEYSHVFESRELQEAVAVVLDRESHASGIWCRTGDGFLTEDQALTAAWSDFTDLLRTRTRYTFWHPTVREKFKRHQIYGEIDPAEVMVRIGFLLRHYGCIKELPAKTRLWRARHHHSESDSSQWSGRDLGTSPSEKAVQQNRMSPAGIPMFYGSVTREGAIQETMQKSDRDYVTSAFFETSVPSTIVDLTKLPEIGSEFDVAARSELRHLSFLHGFVRDLSRPVARRAEAVFYIPTQLVTEYVLHILEPSLEIRGLRFKSVLTGEDNIVLDVANDFCADEATGSELSLAMDYASRMVSRRKTTWV